jgi:hypothetical protein
MKFEKRITKESWHKKYFMKFSRNLNIKPGAWLKPAPGQKQFI